MLHIVHSFIPVLQEKLRLMMNDNLLKAPNLTFCIKII